MADDDVGFPDGLDFYKNESREIKRFLMLVDQIDGAIEREPGPGKSFSFRVDFVEIKYKTKY